MTFAQLNDSFVLDCPYVTKLKHNTFICAHLVPPGLNCTNLGVLELRIDPSTSNYYIDITIESNLGQLDSNQVWVTLKTKWRCFKSGV